MSDFARSDFDVINRVMPSGKVNELTDVDIYWFHAIAKNDAAFYQTRTAHNHKFFELHFILGGSITYITDESDIKLQRGEYILFAPGQKHRIEGYDGSLIKCSAAFAVGIGEELYSALAQKSGKAYKMTDDHVQGIRFISSLSEKGTPYYGILVKNRIFELIHGLADGLELKKHHDTQGKLIDGCDIRIFKAKQFIKDNPHVFLSCADMASYCDISVKQLNRLFIKYEKVTLLDYIHNEKLSCAKKQLTESDAPLREISDNLGFSSVYYFSKFFFEHIKNTPGEYRSAYAADNINKQQTAFDTQQKNNILNFI